MTAHSCESLPEADWSAHEIENGKMQEQDIQQNRVTMATSDIMVAPYHIMLSFQSCEAKSLCVWCVCVCVWGGGGGGGGGGGYKAIYCSVWRLLVIKLPTNIGLHEKLVFLHSCYSLLPSPWEQGYMAAR